MLERVGLIEPEADTLNIKTAPMRKPVQPKGVYDIDRETGVQYYVSEEMVQTYKLPDGTPTRMVFIPGGEFIIGLNDEDPLGIQPSGRIRTGVNSFWMDQTEVTNKQYRAFIKSLSVDERESMMPDSVAWTRSSNLPWNLYFRGEAYEDYPVACVNWHQAKRFAEWAGKELPSEVEWEYAARSGVSGRIYPWPGIYASDPRSGGHMANYAPNGNYAADGYVVTSPVKTYPANNFRLYDMAGNVAEWCADAYFPSYKILRSQLKKFITPSYLNKNEPRKIVRGGSWASEAFFIGVGVRDYRMSEHSSPKIGFRCVKRDVNPFNEYEVQKGFELRRNRALNPNVVEAEGIAEEINRVLDSTQAAQRQQAAAVAAASARAQGQTQGTTYQPPQEEPGTGERVMDSVSGFFRNVGNWFSDTWNRLTRGNGGDEESPEETPPANTPPPEEDTEESGRP